MEFSYILFAFICGLLVKNLNLPPLIGFLAAGFLLNASGFTANDTLKTLADMGITLMLFTIGLKLNVRDLYKKEVWLGSSVHMITWTMVVGSCFLGLGSLGLGLFAGFTMSEAALLGFALSFSSTVCVIKLLEDSGELKTRHGKLAVGILIMQDIYAVAFLVITTGKVPSPWALLLLLLLILRTPITSILSRVGHGELLPLTGFLLAFGSYELFESVGIKGDLGALLGGMLFAGHTKAAELAKSLLSFKDLFLIGFFLSIGFVALPDWQMIVTALLLCALLPFKFAVFFLLLTRMQLRSRTSYLSSLVLNNYSEFGLIVIAMMVSIELLAPSWLVVLALAVSFSFIFTSIAYRSSHHQYSNLKQYLKRYEHPVPLPEDTYEQPVNAQVLVLGLGRVGKGAYLSLQNALGSRVWGVDADPVRISRLKKKGMQVMVGDGEDIDFWENTKLENIELVLLAVPSVEDTGNITEQLREANYQGKVAAIARYEDEIQPLLDAGTDKVFNFFTEAGTGFAEESLLLITTNNK